MSIQTSLEKWVSIKNIKKEIPIVFYLDWNNDLCYPNKQAVWLSELPSSYNFKKSIYWKDFKTNITICGNLNYNYLEYPEINDIPYIKSHIQKSIRRNLDQHSVKSSLDFIKLDFNNFLRRVPIIMIEDVYIHKSINTIIWMMAAFDSTKTIKEVYSEFIDKNKNKNKNNTNTTKNILYDKWLPTINQISWILGVMSLLSRIEHRIIVPDEYKNNIFNYKLFKEQINKIPIKYSSLLYSIMLRKSYGGMKNDMIMINNYLNYYYNILINKDFFIKYKKIYLIPIKSIELTFHKLSKEEWLIEAMDFHCKPNILNSLQNYFIEEDYKIEDLKKTIWYNCSGINNKNNIIFYNNTTNNINNNFDKIWENIKKKYFSLCYYHKNMLFS